MHYYLYESWHNTCNARTCDQELHYPKIHAVQFFHNLLLVLSLQMKGNSRHPLLLLLPLSQIGSSVHQVHSNLHACILTF